MIVSLSENTLTICVNDDYCEYVLESDSEESPSMVCEVLVYLMMWSLEECHSLNGSVLKWESRVSLLTDCDVISVYDSTLYPKFHVIIVELWRE